MSVSLVAAGAAAGAGSGLLNRKTGRDTKETPEFAEEQKPFLAASQFQIPFFLQMLTGGRPEFLQRYLQQTRSTLQQGTQQNLQNYLRQIGQQGGGDFGAQQQAGIQGIYESQNPALAQGLTSTRNKFVQQALQQMGRWSELSPQGKTTRTPKQPGPGTMAGVGALQGVSRGLGAPKTAPMKPTATAQPPAAPSGVSGGTTLGPGATAATQRKNLSPLIQQILANR